MFKLLFFKILSLFLYQIAINLLSRTKNTLHSKYNNDLCHVDLLFSVTIPPGTVHCSQVIFEELGKYIWPETLPGPSEKDCPKNQTGIARWDCLENGEWATVYPDFR